MNRKLDAFFNPKSIAIVGASNTEDSVGYRLLDNIKNSGYNGNIYPINPKYKICQNFNCYPKLTKLDEVPQLVMIVVNAKLVLDIIKEGIKIGAKNYYIITAGFGELGEEGKEIEKELTNLAKKYDLNIIGPNTIGFVNNNISLNANFAQSKCKNGNAVLISQSGALAGGIMNILETSQVGLQYVVSIGNACDVSVADLINYFSKKKEIKQILLYLEGIPSPNEFMQACQNSTKKIICVKSGRSTKGAQAASSHTGALASSDTIVDAFLHQCGIIRANTISEMVDIASIFATTLTTKCIKNVAVITNAGGPAIMTVDALSQDNLNLYEFSKEEKEYLHSYLPKQASVKNPIDMVASASVEDYKKTLEFCINNENIDAIICIHLYIMGTKSMEIATLLENMKKTYPNKLITSIFITKYDELNEIKHKLENIPVLNFGEDASKALKYLNIENNQDKPKSKKIRNTKIQTIINNAKKDNRNLLTTLESLEILDALQLPTINYFFAKNIEEIIKNAKKLKFPVVAKITSKTISHKSDVGGVKVNIQNANELINAIEEINRNLLENNCYDGLDGYIIQEMMSSNREFVYGIINDSQFGLASMFGLGGIFVETFKDVNFKILPASNSDIDEQINGLKASKLLKKVRNLPPANIDSLKNIMKTINDFAMSYNIKELDLNPLLIDDKTGQIVLIDARIKI